MGFLDTLNHRIQIFNQDGGLILCWGGFTSDARFVRLWQPRKVAFISETNRVVVSDRGRDGTRLQIFTREGEFIKLVRQVGSALSVGLTIYKDLVSHLLTIRYREVNKVISHKKSVFMTSVFQF